MSSENYEDSAYKPQFGSANHRVLIVCFIS